MVFVFKKIIRIPKYFLGIYFKIGLKKREGTRVIGITNKIGRHYVLFIDYDITSYKTIKDEITSLQKDYNLSTAHIFKTGRGYHVIIPDLLTFNEIKKILSECTIEEAYLSVPANNKKKVWVLRITDKKNNHIKYYDSIKSPVKRRTSKPHIKNLYKRGVPKEQLLRQLLNSSYDKENIEYATYEA